MTDIKTNGNFGKNIRLLRKQKGLTQVELAKKLECSQAMITAYEKNLKKPSVDTLAHLANILSASIDQILGNEMNTTEEKIKNPKLWKKFSELEQLPGSDKRTVFRIIDGLLSQNKSKSR